MIAMNEPDRPDEGIVRRLDPECLSRPYVRVSTAYQDLLGRSERYAETYRRSSRHFAVYSLFGVDDRRARAFDNVDDEGPLTWR
jgi:hypothetical protein